jgi:uncharacterized membrane protein YbhN (UPF0104 family)
MPRAIVLTIKLTLAVSMLVALIIWVQAHYDWAEILRAWQGVAPFQLAIFCALVGFSHLLRVLRIHKAYSLNNRLPLREVAAVSLVHNTVSFLLPMRLGELALPILSRKRLNVSYQYSAASLLLVRLFDAHVLLILLLFVGAGLWLDALGWILCVCFLLLSPLALFALRWLARKHDRFADVVRLLSSSQQVFALYLLTAAIWLVKISALALLVVGLSGLSIDHALLGTIIADASALSPITGLANAGTFEAAFALPLLPLGHDMDTLVTTALNLHLFVLVTNVIAGLCGWLLFKRS